ncbi:MAG: hypothetical protein K2P93_07465 [Alphaproteobacteria bacterium]|nr:hypothetical protein [Alphaproteobacteria bacterium]
MLSTPEFWVFIAFVLLFVGFGKKGMTVLTQVLDKYRDKVIHQLSDAQRLHDEAQSLLESYKKKYEEALKQAEQIISYAESEAQEFKKSSEYELERFIKQKEKTLLDRLTLEKEETKAKLKKQAADEALEIVERILIRDHKERKKLTQTSLNEISAVLVDSKENRK